MTDPPLSTVMPSEAATPSGANQTARTASFQLLASPVTKNFVTREHDLVFRAFFPTPAPPAKFHPIPAMTQLFCVILKDEPSLVLRTPTNDQQLILASTSLPTGESAFKKYFKVTTVRLEKHNKTQVCIGCHVLSNRSLSNIKFRSTDGNLLTWLKKERIFLESDHLGIDCPVTTGYFTKIAPSLTHLANFREHIVNQLMLVDIEADTAVELAPHLKQARLDAMTSGDDFIPILPEFEIYRTRLSHGREPSQVSTDVLGVKCAPKDAKLLGEFLTRMAATTTDQRDGVYIPKGAAYLLGLTTYAQILQDNNVFINSVASIPVNLAYEAWFAVIDPNQTSDNEPISLHDHLVKKSWFLRIESVAPNKCLLVTTQNNLQDARDWIDANLEQFVRKSIPEGLNPPSALLPRRLDKPVYSATTQTYADILKKQFPIAATPNTTATISNRSPRKRQATLIDYNSDDSTSSTAITAVSNNNSQPTVASPPAPTATPTNYAAELLSLKHEIESLKTTIATAIEQIKTAIKPLLVNQHNKESCAMDTDDATATDDNYCNHAQIGIPSLIHELKNEIATFVIETRALLQQKPLVNQNHLSSVT